MPRPGHRRRRCPQKEEIQETRVSFALSLHNRLAAVPHHKPPTERGSRGPRGRSPEKQRRRVFGSRARGWGGAVDVRPGAHVRLPPPSAPVTRDSLQTPLVTGFPWSALRPQRYRLADLTANVSKRSRRLVHLRFPVARVTPLLAGSASLRLGVCSRGCTRVPGGVVTSVRQGRTLTVGSQETWGRRSLGVGGQQEPAGRTPGPGREPTALTRAAGAAGAAGHLGGDHFPDDAAPRGSSGNWPSRPRRQGPRGPLHHAQVPKNEREMQYLKKTKFESCPWPTSS